MSEIKNVILLAVALMIVAVIFPIALGLIGLSADTIIGGTNNSVNGTDRSLAEIVDPSIITLLTVLLPIIAIIAIVLFFLPKVKKS